MTEWFDQELSSNWQIARSIRSHELNFKNYNVYRLGTYDRSNNTSSLSTGGGVCIAVNNKFFSRSMKLPYILRLEILFVLIKLDQMNLIISSVYIPNNSSLELFTDYFDCVASIYYNYPNSHIVLLGDYNLPSANFSNVFFFFFW